MNSVCRYHMIKPFADKKDTRRSSAAEFRFSDDAEEYFIHPDSKHLPGTPEGVICGGDFSNCGIPRRRTA